MERVHSSDVAAKRKRQLAARNPHKYKIVHEKDEGFGAFHLYQDGDWLETFRTQAAAEAEQIARMEYDAIGR